MPSLLITVRFLDDRFNGLKADGRPEWPPSPGRLFQALVAGAARGASLPGEDQEALAWIERLAPPLIAAPRSHKGQSFRHFVPNNDMDTVDGDPTCTAEIRSATKRFHPQIFDHESPLLYLWSFDEGLTSAERMVGAAMGLYQLGRGVDMAWAVAEILDNEDASNRLAAYPGTIHRPCKNGGGRQLACPVPGSLQSLIERHAGARMRFQPVVEAVPGKRETAKRKVTGQVLAQQPKTKFQMVAYDSPPLRLLYDLRDASRDAGLFSWPCQETLRLVEMVRNAAAQRLSAAEPEKTARISRIFGLSRDATESDKASRIRIIPLPSIGHPHADHAIRRILVEIPPDCSLSPDDVAWAFSQVEHVDEETGEILWTLVGAENRGMLTHYGADSEEGPSFRTWRTVTPMVLPVLQPSGRMKGADRVEVQSQASGAVAQALRHAGLPTGTSAIRVQREPFDAKGRLATDFASGTRFPPSRMWHAELRFGQPVRGPIVMGDGRYLGLGLFRPIQVLNGIYTLPVLDGLQEYIRPQDLARALRRAIMALIQEKLGVRTPLPLFFTGHEADGLPARRGGRTHLAFSFDKERNRLLVVAPHRLEGREATGDERRWLAALDQVLVNLRVLRAGRAGLLHLGMAVVVEEDDPLVRASKVWESQTPYRPTKYAKDLSANEGVVRDFRSELTRRGLPLPENVTVVSVSAGPRGGLRARLLVTFATAAAGPILLGRDSNLGGGLFVVAET
jgi:CRISPR-associated protein Csb2